jgi:hypothetical protein
MEKLFKGAGEVDPQPSIDASAPGVPPGIAGITPPFYGVSDPAKASADAAKWGNDILRAAAAKGIQAGDPQYFPTGVDLTFQGGPDVAKDVTWASATSKFDGSAGSNAGGPSNGYFPDISSPGAGKTDGVDKTVDPKIVTTDIKPNIVPGSDANTKNPSSAGTKLYDANALGNKLPPGASGG